MESPKDSKATVGKKGDHKRRGMGFWVTLGVCVFGVLWGLKSCGFFGPGKNRWKEEVQLTDGRVIVIVQEVIRGYGGDEILRNPIGTRPKDNIIRFTDPKGSGKTIEWRSTKKEPSSGSPEIPLIFDMESGHPVIFSAVYINEGCVIYTKYVYQNDAWMDEQLPEVFAERPPNLYLGRGTGAPRFVDLETKREENEDKGYALLLQRVGPKRRLCINDIPIKSGG